MAGGQRTDGTPGEDLTGELERALRVGDVAAARRLGRAGLESGDGDELLAVLARQAGDPPWAVDLLVEMLDASGTVHRFAAAALLDQDAVDDVSQDALISIASSVSSWDGRGKVTTWVHSIVRRRVVDHLRRRRETAALTDDLSPTDRMSSVIAARTTVRAALAELPELYRVPVVQRDVESRPYAEIAEDLGRPVGTIKAQISRGRAMVAARIGEEP